MSKYNLNVKSSLSLESEIKELSNMLNKNDSISIYTNENISKDSIVKLIEKENLNYKYINDEGNNYILVKRE